jgi:hypothetical protein
MMEALDVLSHVIPDKDKAEAITHAFRAIIKKAKGPEAKETSTKRRKSDSEGIENKFESTNMKNSVGKEKQKPETEYANTVTSAEKNEIAKTTSTQTNLFGETSHAKSEQSSSNITQSFAGAGKKRRKSISVKITRKVKQEACYCCSLVDPKTGIRCNSTYQIQTDHIIPLALGGTNDIDNLRVLCGVHNRSEAARRGLRPPPK